jgi:hypothetical protein
LPLEMSDCTAELTPEVVVVLPDVDPDDPEVATSADGELADDDPDDDEPAHEERVDEEPADDEVADDEPEAEDPDVEDPEAEDPDVDGCHPPQTSWRGGMVSFWPEKIRFGLLILDLLAWYSPCQ